MTRKSESSFEEGDFVVYPTHGVGRILGTEEREVAGMMLEMLVVRFEHDRMTLRVPMEKAKSLGLRTLSSKKQMEQAITTDKDRIARNSISGTPNMRNGASIVEAPQSEIDAKVEAWLNPEFEQGSATTVVSPNSVRVQVRNGNGRLLDAETATDQLRQKGFDAVSGGNADSFGTSETVVAYAEGQREAAKRGVGEMTCSPAASISSGSAPRSSRIKRGAYAGWRTCELRRLR